MPKKEVKVRLMSMIPCYGEDARIESLRLVGRVQGHPRIQDDHRVLTSPVIKIETENTIYVLDDAGASCDVCFDDVLTALDS
jgi:hypothetical protein